MIKWTDEMVSRMIEFYEDGRLVNDIARILKIEFSDRSVNKTVSSVR